MNATASPEKIAIAASTPPAIGQPWPQQGGIYAGIARGVDGAADHHLVVGPDATDPATLNWKAANAWAQSLHVDGHQDFTLPTRREQSILYGNVPELFSSDWYWSGTPYASAASYAWAQYFLSGRQDDGHKVNRFRARAVRRLAIQ